MPVVNGCRKTSTRFCNWLPSESAMYRRPVASKAMAAGLFNWFRVSTPAAVSGSRRRRGPGADRSADLRHRDVESFGDLLSAGNAGHGRGGFQLLAHPDL